jgi:hypothetical protein
MVGPFLLGVIMPSAFVRPKTGNYFVLSTTKDNVRNSATGWCVEVLKPDAVLSLASREDIGDTTLKAGQKVILDFGTLSKNKYTVMVEVNPQLHPLALVSGPGIIEPGTESTDLQFVVRAEKQINLEEFSWFLKIFLVD